MWVKFFLCLVIAHLVADFVLQTDKVCLEKSEKKWRSVHHYIHAIMVFLLSWLVAFDLRFWWCAALIGITHFAIDMWKSYREEKVVWFTIDQALHISILAVVAWLW